MPGGPVWTAEMDQFLTAPDSLDFAVYMRSDIVPLYRLIGLTDRCPKWDKTRAQLVVRIPVYAHMESCDGAE